MALYVYCDKCGEKIKRDAVVLKLDRFHNPTDCYDKWRSPGVAEEIASTVLCEPCSKAVVSAVDNKRWP